MVFQPANFATADKQSIPRSACKADGICREANSVLPFSQRVFSYFPLCWKYLCALRIWSDFWVQLRVLRFCVALWMFSLLCFLLHDCYCAAREAVENSTKAAAKSAEHAAQSLVLNWCFKYVLSLWGEAPPSVTKFEAPAKAMGDALKSETSAQMSTIVYYAVTIVSCFLRW